MAGPAKMRTCLSLHAEGVCWSSFGDPKHFLNALVPCGHTYCDGNPRAVNVIYFVTFGACTP